MQFVPPPPFFAAKERPLLIQGGVIRPGATRYVDDVSHPCASEFVILSGLSGGTPISSIAVTQGLKLRLLHPGLMYFAPSGLILLILKF